MSVDLVRIHHVAYRCKDAKETVDFYQRVLNRFRACDCRG